MILGRFVLLMMHSALTVGVGSDGDSSEGRGVGDEMMLTLIDIDVLLSIDDVAVIVSVDESSFSSIVSTSYSMDDLVEPCNDHVTVWFASVGITRA